MKKLSFLDQFFHHFESNFAKKSGLRMKTQAELTDEICGSQESNKRSLDTHNERLNKILSIDIPSTELKI